MNRYSVSKEWEYKNEWDDLQLSLLLLFILPLPSINIFDRYRKFKFAKALKRMKTFYILHNLSCACNLSFCGNAHTTYPLP